MKDSKSYVRRLNIIKGQIEGIKKMIENGDSECLSVLTQIKAAKQGLNKVGEGYMRERMSECLQAKSGTQKSEEEIGELLKMVSL